MADFYPIARNLLFRLDAERAHHVTLAGMRLVQRLGLLKPISGPPSAAEKNEPVRVMGLDFPNRVGLGAGMDKTGSAVDAFGAIGFGHVEVGTVTPRPQPGNEKPRLFRLVEHDAIINRMGFNNPGVEQMMKNLESSARDFKGVLGINIGKNFDTPNENALDDYLACFEGVYEKADYVTANLSSPNTKGLRDLQNVETCRELITALQNARETLSVQWEKYVPVTIKIAPDLTDEQIRGLAGVFSESGIDGVIATNTTIARDAVASHARADEAGGLSGAPLTDRSTEVIRLLREALDDSISIIGVGGIMSGEDAQAKLDAGCELVQVYSGLVFRGPALVHECAML
ncbi:MAG: quinone-dependent dihydroorotate dehydrogenase [Verrucomicrobiales bacterium]|nr:quinone-dependent dihydroorotate dehydrogenase [Verrucomicrobiales bacterium]